MDDAGNGRRGLRATPMANVRVLLRERYGIEGSQARDLGGSSCLNLLIADGQARYVARVYRPYVTAGRLAALHLVRRTLERGAVPCAPLVPTQAGSHATLSLCSCRSGQATPSTEKTRRRPSGRRGWILRTHTHQPNAARAGSRSNWEVLGLVLRRLRRQPTPKQR